VRQLTATRVVLASASVWALCAVFVGAQAPQTIWSGVYTEAQAYRGEKVAQTSCVGCHGSGLDGGDSGPKLAGAVFLENWSTQSVAQLFDYVRESMPADAPGTLSKEDTAAVLAYILKVNKMPEGKQDLSADHDELNRIEIVAGKP
jgi:mono/diheme cytochrome c family protein